MRNLKRALSLALAAIMLIGMMVIGASATDYKDFTDNGDIVNRDAVTMLTTLGVIDGKPDGTYAPTELVTRDQMAKMISVILNQGADVNDVYANLDSGLTDISSNWAKGHINYCYTLGVIAGRGDGTFDPGANVTAAEAAKMLLVAAGYDPTTEGFVGAQWSWNVNAKASSLGIYKNYTKGVLEPLNRDDAALLIYNALDIERIERYENGYARVYNDNRTILSSLYGVYKVVGVVIGNEWAQLEQTGIQDALAPGKTRVAQMNVLASDTLQTQIWANGIPSVYQFNVSTEEALLGKAVTMFIRKETILNNIEVLGVVYNEDLNTVVTLNSNKTALSDATKDTGLSIRSEGTNKTEFYVNYGYQATSAAAQTELGIDRANRNGIVMEIIDNNDDGVVDYVLYKKEDLAVVSGLSRDGESVTIRGVNDNKSIDKDDMVTNLELALDDVVLVITYGGRYYVTEPQIVTGEMNSYTANRETEQSIEVDGATYKPSFIGRLTESVTSANGVGDIIDFDVLKCEEPTGVDFDITYDFFLDSNGFVRAFRPTEQSLPNYALVLNSGYDPGVYSSEASGKVTVLLADGTEGTYPINFSTSASNLAKQLMYTGSASIAGTTFSKADRGVIELKGFLGTDYTDNSPTRPWRFEDGVDTNANTYVFAYDNHNTESDAVNGNVNPNDYKAGQAAGYVIRYTLNDSGVMTIQSVMGTVAPGYAVNLGMYTNTDLSVTDRIHTLSTRQGTLSTAYASGNARVYYAAGQAVAVDKNTVAFYYDEVEAADLATGGKYANRTDVSEGDILYGVAVGYENMADVRQGGQFLASNIVSTTYNSRTDSYEYESTNLADMILFDEANVITARDYAFVVDTNTRDSSNVTLNVIFEDGKAGTLTISRSNYDNVIEDRDGFQKPYAYTIGADDKATIYDGSPIGEGRVWRLQNGTVAMDSVQQFWPYSVNTVNIWDVTDLDEGEDGVKMADFVRDNNGINYRGYLILNTDGSVRTAFIWESDDTTPVVGHSHDWNWRLTDSTTLYPYSSIANINDEFTAGHDVTIRGDYTVSGSSFLYIPEGRTLRVEGNFTQNVRIYGGGKLWVGGDYTMNYDGIEVTTQIDGDLILRDTTPDINALVGVKGDVTETVPGSVTLTIGAYDSANSTGGDLHMIGAASDVEVQHLTINGHMEAVHINVPGNVIINSTNTLIARGNVTIGTLTIGGTAAGSMTVMGTFDVNTANVNEGTLNLQGATNVVHTTMTVGTATKTATVALGQSSLALSNGATLTVDDKGTVTANNVTLASGATSATVNVDGTVTLGGELNAGTGTVTVASTGKVTVETVNKDTVVSNEGVVTVNKTSNDPVKVQGASLNGTFAGDVTLSAASTIKADDTMTVNGKFDGGTALTMEAKATLVLNGKENVLPTTLTATAGAKIVFGAGATIGTGSDAVSNFYLNDGTTAVTADKVAGMTFTYTSDNKWVSDKTIAVAADANIDIANVTMGSTGLANTDYSISADTTAKAVTVIVKSPTTVNGVANTNITTIVLNVPTDDTVAVATNNATWNSANKTLTVSGLTGTPKTVKLEVSGSGKTTVTYTFYVSTSATITNAPSQPTEPTNPDVGAGE